MLQQEFFRVDDPGWIRDVARAHPWAALISHTAHRGLVVSHLPVLVEELEYDLNDDLEDDLEQDAAPTLHTYRPGTSRSCTSTAASKSSARRTPTRTGSPPPSPDSG
jgi:hypothetical protein